MIKTFGLPLAAGLLLAATTASANPPADALVTRDDGGNLVISWTDSNPVDVFASDRPDAKFARTGVISAKDADGRHIVAQTGGQPRQFFILRDSRTGEATRVAERLLPLAQGSNFRDIGGYPTTSGRHVKWGLIYRAGATPLLTAQDVAQIRQLGLVNMIDLRSSEERQLAPTRLNGIRYTALDYSMLSMMGSGSVPSSSSMFDLYRNMPQFLAPHLKIVFGDLLAKKGPIMYHCSAGQDRTGVTTALILSALGVPRDQIIADYHLSTRFRHPEFEMPPISPALAETNPVAKMFAGYQQVPNARTPNPLKGADGKAFLEGAFAEIDSKWGTVDGYLKREIGLTDKDIRDLRRAYTE